MSSQPQSAVRRALADLASGASDSDRSLRTLVGHDGWFVPAGFARDGLGLAVFERTLLLGPTPDPPSVELAIFTDVESALTAYGQPLGPYVGGVSGIATFAALDDAFTSLRINPASPSEEQWNVDRDAFARCRLWADALALERDLAASAGAELPYRRLRGYAGYSVLLGKADGGPILAPLADGGHAAFAFTAPDRADAFVARLPDEQRAAMTAATLDGAALFGNLVRSTLSGLVVNGDDPAATVFVPRAAFEAVAGS